MCPLFRGSTVYVQCIIILWQAFFPPKEDSLSINGQILPLRLLLTLGAHAQEGYATCLVCVCLCVSVPTLASTAFVSTVQVRYVRLLFRLYSILNSWIFNKAFRSKVMV